MSTMLCGGRHVARPDYWDLSQDGTEIHGLFLADEQGQYDTWIYMGEAHDACLKEALVRSGVPKYGDKKCPLPY